MRSTKAGHNFEQAGRIIVPLFDYILVSQNIHFGKNICGTLVALGGKGIKPHAYLARTHNDDHYGRRHLKSQVLPEIARFVAEHIQRLVSSILYHNYSNQSLAKSPKTNFRFSYGYQQLLLLALNELPKRRCRGSVC